MSAVAEMTREERDVLIFQLKAEGQLSQGEIGKRVGLSGTRVGRILNAKGGATSNGNRTANLRTGPQKVEYRCAIPGCRAVLKSEHWVYSSHTGTRYCWPGEGCWLWSPEKRKREREANALVPAEEEA